MPFTDTDLEKFRILKVTGVALAFEALAADEANDNLTPEQLFLTAVDDALDARRAARVEKLIRSALFPLPMASVAELDYREGRGITKNRIRRYAAQDWRTDPMNLVIVSPTGGGKTYLACALGIAACQNEYAVRYWRMDVLARRLVLARGDGIAHQKLLNELSEVEVLIIDDFLTVGIDSDAASDLFTVLANREHHRPTVIASQTSPAYWLEALPDRVAADSIVNRIANNAKRIDLGQVDMRQVSTADKKAQQGYWE